MSQDVKNEQKRISKSVEKVHVLGLSNNEVIALLDPFHAIWQAAQLTHATARIISFNGIKLWGAALSEARRRGIGVFSKKQKLAEAP